MSVTLGLVSILVLYLVLVPHGNAAANLVVGQAAPDFTVDALDGTKVRLSELKGKPVVINFWATWCGPCRKEMPDMEAVYQQFKAAGLQVYGINVGESKVSISDFVNKVGATFPIAVDTHEEAQNAYKILPIPATFFIDANGTIKSIYQYQMSRSQIEAEVIRLLGNIER
jgi:cytochrome c biogenesis protein CcmG, thiol:disulfide interchange protein DsbE